VRLACSNYYLYRRDNEMFNYLLYIYIYIYIRVSLFGVSSFVCTSTINFEACEKLFIRGLPAWKVHRFVEYDDFLPHH
jgi:hypothetical protein